MPATNPRPENVAPLVRLIRGSEGRKLNSSQTVMSSRKHRGQKYRPYVFTEQGIAMLSSVLRSLRAVEVNIAIKRLIAEDDVRKAQPKHGIGFTS